MQCLNSLIITTSNRHLNDSTNKTGVWLKDLAVPYFILKDSGDYITVASPLGGQIPLDNNYNAAEEVTEITARFYQDAQAMYHFSHSLPLNEIKAEEFDLLFLVGGYGCMWDFPENKWLHQLIHNFYNQQKPIGLVGHAVASLISLTTKDMEPFVKGVRLTAFSNDEQAAAGLNEQPPFSLESALISLGALYSKGPNFENYVVSDHYIVTGQNPASVTETSKQTIALAHQLKLTGEFEIQ